ncbi:MAG: hypothetical protein ACOCRX_08440, partial [Candidatus Woesearchaeota archaeon]
MIENFANEYMNHYLAEDEINWTDLPQYEEPVSYKPALNVNKVSFCSRSNKHKKFLVKAYLLESKIERINLIFNQHAEMFKEIKRKCPGVFNAKKNNDKEIIKHIGRTKFEEFKWTVNTIKKNIPTILIKCKEIK